MPELIDCFSKAGLPHLREKYQKMVASGMSEPEAANKILLEEQKGLQEKLNAFKKSIKLPQDKYEPFDNSEKIKSLNESQDQTPEVPQQAKNEAADSGEINKNVTGSGEGKPPNPPPLAAPVSNSNGEQIGISHEARIERADKTNETLPERGEGLTVEEAIQLGQKLIADGADPKEAAKAFKENGRISENDMSIVRAEYERLARETNKASDQFGIDSNEEKEAKAKESKWYNEVVKPMQTVWHKIGQAQQGRTDIDTGSYVGLRRAFEEQHGKEMKPKQQAKAKELSSKVKSLTSEVETLKKKLTEVLDKGGDTSSKNPKRFTEKAKKVAERFRKLKQKPFRFKGEDGEEHDIEKMGIGWNDLVEIGAKAIEKTGEIADGVAAIIEKIKDTDFYAKLSANGRKELEQQLSDHYENSIAETPESKNIKRLEKQLSDLQRGVIGDKKEKREPSNREKELIRKIKEEKENLGLNEKIKPVQVQPKNSEADNFYDLASKFVDKEDNKFTAEDSKGIWDYAKENYLDKDANFDDMIHGVAFDLGLKPTQVRYALSQPKGAKTITDEMYRKQYQRTAAVNRATQWVKQTEKSKLVKAVTFLPRGFFRLATFGHGTVGAITHAGFKIFTPSDWAAYWPSVIKQFKFAYGNTAKYQQAMEDLVRDKQFIFWKRNGLAVDPTTRYDDFQTFDKMFGKLGTAGDRGFNALKVMRLEMAKLEWSRRSASEKADPQTAKEIALLVNHSTGTSKVPLPEAANVAFFAPRLEASRWSRIIIQPAEAVKTFVSWNSATPAEKAKAKIVARKTGEIMATYMAALAANQGILIASGSSQRINFTNPFSSDFLKFKVAGKTLDFSGGMISSIDFLVKLANTPIATKDQLKGETRNKAFWKSVGQYTRGKFSPFTGTAFDFLTHHDISGNTLPFSNDKPNYKKAHKLSWLEYSMSKSPIPVAEAYKDVSDQMREKGIPQPQINDILQGVIIGASSGGTGVRINNEPEAQIPISQTSKSTKHPPSKNNKKGVKK